MTTTAEPTTTEPRVRRGGRPRDPSRGAAIIDAVIDILATLGLAALTADDVAAAAGVGKATIYRRWHTIDDLLVDAVSTLGVRPQDVDLGPVVGGTLRGDLIAVVTAATTGRRAQAERAILSALPHSAELRIAYRTGPMLNLDDRLDAIMERAIARGDATSWPGNAPIHAAIALIHHNSLTERGEMTRIEAVLRQTGVLR